MKGSETRIDSERCSQSRVSTGFLKSLKRKSTKDMKSMKKGNGNGTRIG